MRKKSNFLCNPLTLPTPPPFSLFIQTTQASELCYCDFSIQCFDFPSKSLRFFTSKVCKLLFTRSQLSPTCNLCKLSSSDDEIRRNFTLMWFFLAQRREKCQLQPSIWDFQFHPHLQRQAKVLRLIFSSSHVVLRQIWNERSRKFSFQGFSNSRQD